MANASARGGRFGRIPEWLLDAPIPDRAKVLYALLTRYEPDIRPKRRTLADRLGCSTKAVDRALDELEGIGAIKKEPRFTERGDQTSNRIWMLADAPSDPLDTSVQGAPSSPGSTLPRHGRPDPLDSGDEAWMKERKVKESKGKGGQPAKQETTPATVEPPTPAWSADDYLAALVEWARAERNPTYALTPETRRELREHLAGSVAAGLDPTAIAAGLKSWFTDPKGPGPIALSRHIDKAQRDPRITIAYWASLHEGEDDPGERGEREEAERAARLVEALEAEGAIHVGGGQWEVSEGGVLPNPARAVRWLAARGVTIE